MLSKSYWVKPYYEYGIPLAAGDVFGLTFIVPMPASTYRAFFNEEGGKDLSLVQWVYLAMSLLGVMIVSFLLFL
jgi:hypothetical protein